VRFRLPLVLACTFLALVPGFATAQIVPGWNTKQFALERIDADRFRLMREVEIEGEAGGANAGQKFFADDLEMNIRTGELTARGNVVFQTPTSRIAAESIVFNTTTKLGTFNNAMGIAQLGERGLPNRSMFGTLEPDVYFYGTVIEKIGVDKYSISKGGFTTCVQPTPRWQIVSGRATVNLNDYVVMKNAVVRVKNVPVFYLPILYYPIQEDNRATGFLMPTYATSTYSGGSISNAFFWAVNRSQDVTVFHDWFFSGSTGVGTEYRYLLGPTAQGNFRAYALDEKERELNGTLITARQNKLYSGGLSQGLPLGLTARGNVNYTTDIGTQQLYSDNYAQAVTSQRILNGAIAGAWDGLSLNSAFSRTEYFYSSTDSQISGRAPGLSVAYAAQKLPRLPVYFSVNADAAKVLYITNSATTSLDRTVNTFDLLPTIRAPLSKLPFLSVNASLAYRRTYVSESLAADKVTQVEVPITREYADMRAEVVGPVFSRVFSPNNAFASRLKHVIEPSYGVQKRTTISVQDQMPLAVSEIIIGGTTQFTYGLANRVLMRRDNGDPAEKASREILNVSIRQSYYTDEKASQYDPSYGYGYLYRPGSPFSPVALSARASPVKPLDVDFRMEYDPRTEAPVKVVGFGLNGTYVTNLMNVSAGWTRINYGEALAGSSNNYIRQTTQLQLAGGAYGGTVSFNYDFTRATLVNHRYVAFYNAQCCGISFEYIAYNYGSGTTFLIPQNRRFNMSFTLAGVGSFSNFFGAFGGGSY
jgi:LPS-assembly protein